MQSQFGRRGDLIREAVAVFESGGFFKKDLQFLRARLGGRDPRGNGVPRRSKLFHATPYHIILFHYIL